MSILGLLAFLQQRYSLPLYLVGILSTVFILSQIGVSLFAGRIARAIRSHNVILLAIASSGLSWLMLCFAQGTGALYVAYALAGIASGLFEPIGNSLIAKSSDSKNRGTAIGNFAAFGDLGRIAVIAVSTALAGWLGVNNACGVLFLLNAAALVVAASFLSKTKTAFPSASAEEPANPSLLMRNSRFRYATAAGIADSFSSASLYIFIPFLLEAKGINLSNTLYFNVIFFAGYMAGRLVLGRVADRFGAPRTLVVSEVLMAALILLLTFSSGSTAILLLLFVLGIFTRGTSPIIRAMVADAIEPRGSFHDAFSVYSFASRSSSAVCRPIYGCLAAYSGIAVVFYVASAVSMLTLYPAVRYARKID